MTDHHPIKKYTAQVLPDCDRRSRYAETGVLQRLLSARWHRFKLSSMYLMSLTSLAKFSVLRTCPPTALEYLRIVDAESPHWSRGWKSDSLELPAERAGRL